MRRLTNLLSLFLTLFLPVQGWAANSLGGIATDAGNGNGSVNLSITTDSITPTPTAGSTLGVAIHVVSDNSTTITCLGNKSNSFSRIAGSPTNVSGELILVFHAVNIATSAGHTVTCNFFDSHARDAQMIVFEIKGAATSSPFDVMAPSKDYNEQATPGTGANAVTSTAATTSASGDFIFGATQTSDMGKVTGGTGFTEIARVAHTFQAQYLIQGAASSIAATWTNASGTQHRSLMGSWKVAGGGGGAPQ